MNQSRKRNGIPLHTRILLALLLGAAAGVAANLTLPSEPVHAFVSTVTEPAGRIWLNALIMVVIPLIVSTLSLGVHGLGDLKTLGRIGIITLVCFLLLTTLSTVVGLTFTNLFRPGDGLDPVVTAELMETYRTDAEGAMGLGSGRFGTDLFVKIVPRNPVQAMAGGEMLAVIFFSLMIGVALTIIAKEKAEPMVRFMESVSHIVVAIIELVMRAAPIGVFCLIASVTARFGYDLLFQLIQYVGVVLGSLVAFQFLVYPLVVKLAARRDPFEFLKKTRVVAMTAFSTSSSNATLPTTMRVGEKELGLPREIAGFVLPLGATMNMNGTALFEGATVLFIAQVFGVHLTLDAQLIVVLMSVVTAIGTAGIPGGSIPLLMMVLGMVGVPMEGIAIVLGVDRILDMARTTVNVTGDLVTAAVVERFERARGEIN